MQCIHCRRTSPRSLFNVRQLLFFPVRLPAVCCFFFPYIRCLHHVRLILGAIRKWWSDNNAAECEESDILVAIGEKNQAKIPVECENTQIRSDFSFHPFDNSSAFFCFFLLFSETRQSPRHAKLFVSPPRKYASKQTTKLFISIGFFRMFFFISFVHSFVIDESDDRQRSATTRIRQPGMWFSRDEQKMFPSPRSIDHKLAFVVTKPTQTSQSNLSLLHWRAASISARKWTERTLLICTRNINRTIRFISLLLRSASQHLPWRARSLSCVIHYHFFSGFCCFFLCYRRRSINIIISKGNNNHNSRSALPEKIMHI